MDVEILNKYFKVGDHVTITDTNQMISIGTIVELSDSFCVITDQFGNPNLLAIDNMMSCKKTQESVETEKENYNNSVPRPSGKIRLADLTSDQKSQIRELLSKKKDEFQSMPLSECLKYADKQINMHLGLRIRRKSIKSFVSNILGTSPQNKSQEIDSQEGNSQVSINNPFIPATSEIKKYYAQFKNGIVVSANGEDIRFKEDVVIDDELKRNLNDCWSTPIPVICAYKYDKWNVATFLTKPGTLSELRLRINTLKSQGQNELADALLDYLNHEGFQEILESQLDININSAELLTITRRQRLIKNFAEAEKGFLELISRNYELDAVIRDLAAMYQEWQDANKAILLLEEYLPKLEEKVKTYNQLSLLYQTIGNKKAAIVVMEKALKLIPNTTKKNANKIAKLQKRIDSIRKGKLNTTNNQFVFSTEDIQSPLLRYDANNNSEDVLVFVKDKTFEDKMLFINQRIRELKDSPSRPAYYLAKIQLLLDNGESGTDEQIQSLLAEYCKAKARNFFVENNIVSAQEYLLQGICVDDTKTDLYFLLLLSLCCTSNEMLDLYNSQFTTYDEILSSYAIRETSETFHTILRVIKKGSVMSYRLMTALHKSDAKLWLCDELDEDLISLNEFVKCMVSRSNARISIIESFEKQVDTILHSTDISKLAILSLNLPLLDTNDVNAVEQSVFAVSREISNYLLDFENNSNYEDCEGIYRIVLSKIDATIQYIQQYPSHLLVNSFLPLLLKMKDGLDRTLNDKYIKMRPIISIESIGDAHLTEEGIDVQIVITNEEGSSRANSCVIKIDSANKKSRFPLSHIHEFETPLIGGGKLNYNVLIKDINPNNGILQLNYIFTFVDIRKKHCTQSGVLTLSISQIDDFEDFNNPYIAHVKSNAVKDISMFKGRDEIIDTICKYVLEDYKGYVLYGQKRSGKSSVLYHITQRLRAEHKAFAVEYTMGNSIVEGVESGKESLANLFYEILAEIGRAIKEVDRKVYKECGCKIIKRSEFDEHPEETFREYLEFFRDIILEKLHYKQDKIVLIVDEFTYLYYHILEKKISPRIMEFWKGLIESRVFSFVFAGQDAMPRFMDAFQNVFASMHPHELTYIDESSARELIEQPIWDYEKNCSRYHPDAVASILKLTACSPFYIMILCSELVNDARKRKRLPIQVSDVEALIQRMICNESSISRKDFDNLISCGESRLDTINKEDAIKVLKEIAIKSRHVEYYDVGEIKAFEKEKVKTIIADLLRRRVLEPHARFDNKVKIKVELFKRWLLNHE